MPQHSLDCTHQNVLLPTSCYLVPFYWKTRLFSHLAHVVWFAYLKWFKIKWVQTVHLHGVSSCIYTNRHGSHVSNFSKNEWVQRSINMELLHAFYTNMTQMAVPQVCGTIVTILYLLAWTCVSLRSRSNKPFSLVCMTIEGFYSCKQNNNCPLT